MGDPVCYLPFLDEEGRMPEPRVTLRRVYDPPAPGRLSAGRVLVDRWWPPGIRKGDLALDLWARELAPSAGLHRWFTSSPERWDEFARRYRDELRGTEQAGLLGALVDLARQGPLTLLSSARDRRHNHARVILEVIEGRLDPDQHA